MLLDLQFLLSIQRIPVRLVNENDTIQIMTMRTNKENVANANKQVSCRK